MAATPLVPSVEAGASALRISKTVEEARVLLTVARENAQELLEHAQRDLPFLRFQSAVMSRTQDILDEINRVADLDELRKQARELLELIEYASRPDDA